MKEKKEKKKKNFTDEITRGDVEEIAREAYDRVIESMHRRGLTGDWLVLAPDNKLETKMMRALVFAQRITRQWNKGQSIPVVQHRLPRDQYVSWLMVRPFGIAYDSRRTLKSPLVGKGDHPSQDMQIARAIVHELGHIFATPELFATDRPRETQDGDVFTPPCSPKEEGKAWFWAMCVWGTELAFHAWEQRHADHFDNSMATTY